MKRIRITQTDCNFERDPFIRPFGFKGGYVHGAWQTVVGLRSQEGHLGLGLGAQSILWSDASVFAAHSEAGGHAVMFAMSEYALHLLDGMEFTSPIEVVDEILPKVHAYGKAVSGNPDLRLTFSLNALVSVDNALWQLFAQENGIDDFDEMVPEPYRPALAHKHRELACIPLMTYAIPIDEVVSEVDAGYFFLKVKIGADPDGDGDQDKMLAWDMARLEEIHKAVGGKRIPHTEDGKIPYYFDANGRYDTKDRLRRLIDRAEKIGAREQIMIIEEPFPEEYHEDVGDLGVRIAADESAHSDKDAAERIQMGYGAIALKPIAKTMSISLKMAQLAHEANVPCFCADLTVPPILVDWNKCVACRLAPLPGMKIGVVETNGHQNYSQWAALQTYHPCHGAPWMAVTDGLFHLDDDFYARSGGIFDASEHYASLIKA
ncbi:MAG: L-alanine-DL-glutamate epimerase [Planctomycetes bacterium]|nr:L-alanine-DL-glutamate epimerase [Planctomycetota bacterium]MBL7042346.1 L-alanine-DL-glutamate epimerase [Pirellulaceae bacterium]